MTVRVAVTGAAGKMGSMVVDAAQERGDAIGLASLLERPDHPSLGKAIAPGLSIGADAAAALACADVCIDFSTPATTAQLVEIAAAKRVAMVIGTTGLDVACRESIERAAASIPVVLAPNFSLGIGLLLRLVEQMARVLGPDFDVEVVELHHRLKRDAPSGTALALGDAILKGRGDANQGCLRLAREGETGARTAQEVGVMALRGGDVVGEHTVFFLGPGERLEITHRAGSRAIFARGAVRAALWICGKPPGLYGIADVLGLTGTPADRNTG
ncbi:MAG: 4-hydroxy-tetrahydrodipicolinate reductase [Pseudomonadota bacterium]